MRYLFGLLLWLLMVVTPLSARAHDGAHSPDMLAVVNSATTQGNTVLLTLTVTGLGGPLVLTGLSAPGASQIELGPVYINFAQDVTVQTVLDFETPPPGAFTLELIFGPIGQGTVNVVPE